VAVGEVVWEGGGIVQRFKGLKEATIDCLCCGEDRSNGANKRSTFGRSLVVEGANGNFYFF